MERKKSQLLFILSIIVISFIIVPIIGYGIKQSINPPQNIAIKDTMNVKDTITPSNKLAMYDKIIPISKDGVAYSKYRNYKNADLSTLLTGTYSSYDGYIYESYSMNQFLSDIAYSDGIYSYLKPTLKNLTSTHMDNYFTCPVYLDQDNEISLDFAYWLGAQLDSYLALDSLSYNINQFNNIELNNIEDMSSSFHSANDLYLIPNSSSYVFNATNNFQLTANVGGISLYENQLQLMWDCIVIYKEFYNLIIKEKLSTITLEDWLNLYYSHESEGKRLLIMAFDKSMHLASYSRKMEQILSISSFNNFLTYMGIDLNNGYKTFAYYNPSYVSKINGKIVYTFETTSSSNLNNYSIEIYNYYSQSWIKVCERKNDNNILENKLIIDEFFIDINAWQYLDNPYNNKHQVLWRINVNGENINYIFNGIWTQLVTSTSAIDLNLEFSINDPTVTKDLLLKEPEFVIEYTTINVKNDYEKLFLVSPLQNQTGNMEDYIVSVLPGSEFAPSPLKDSRKGYIIPSSIIQNDTTINIRLRGIYGFYDIDGVVQNILIGIDKIYMKYEYVKNIIVKHYACLDFDLLDRIDWVYEINITDLVYEVNITHPLCHEFLAPDLHYIENPNGDNIAFIWSRSAPEEKKYGNNFVRLTQEDINFLGFGRYRFFFKSYNFISQKNNRDYEGTKIINSTGHEKKDNEYIEYDSETSFQIYLKSMYDVNAFNQISCGGSLNVTFTGNKINSSIQTNEIVNGFSHAYNDTIFPESFKYNLFCYNTTFNSTNLTFIGKVEIEFYWESSDGLKIGYSKRVIQLRMHQNVKPYGIFISPTYYKRGEAGYNVDNIVLFKTYHFDTDNIVYNITDIYNSITYQTNRTLYNYLIVEEALNDYYQGTFQNDSNLNRIVKKIFDMGEMPKLPEFENDYKDIYYIDIINPKEIALPKSLDGAPIPYKFSAIIHAEYGIEGEPNYYNNYSIQCNATLDVISQPNIYLYDLYDVFMYDYLTVTYYIYSKNIDTMIFKVNLTTENIVYTISNISRNTDYSWLLTQGSHTYILPYKFGLSGRYKLILEVYDIYNNSIIYGTNEFEIANPDQRTWIIRFLDDTLEYISTWFMLFTTGIVIVKYKKSKNKNYTRINFKDLEI